MSSTIIPQEKEELRPDEKEELNSEIIRSFIAQQGQSVHLEEKKLLLEEKRLEYNVRWIEQAMKYDSISSKDDSTNRRKLIFTQAFAGSLILIIIFSFIGYCLYIGKEEVVNKLIVFFTHSITLILGLFIGRKIRKKGKDNNENDDIYHPEIME